MISCGLGTGCSIGSSEVALELDGTATLLRGVGGAGGAGASMARRPMGEGGIDAEDMESELGLTGEPVGVA